MCFMGYEPRCAGRGRTAHGVQQAKQRVCERANRAKASALRAIP